MYLYISYLKCLSFYIDSLLFELFILVVLKDGRLQKVYSPNVFHPLIMLVFVLFRRI